MTADDANGGEITGYDVPAVEAWIAEHTADSADGGLQPPFEWTRLEGGHSNLTYALTDQGGKRAVVRRPPMGELLPKAHDMGREYSIIAALGPTPVPVPVAYGYCESPDVTGAHFYVMSQVDGRALFGREDVDGYLDDAARANVGRSFMEVLAALHAVDPDEVGLGQLGKKEDYVGRQIRTWYRSWLASAEGAQYEDPVLHELHDFLESRIPEQGPARVVHGDYGLHNCLVSPEGELTAVLDWEISTLGDPLADFAYALNGWTEADDPVPRKDEAVTTAEGFSSRDDLIGWYQERTGADLSMLPFYVSFNHWKTACIIHGVYARYMQGQKSTEGVDLEFYRSRIGTAIERSRAAADQIA